MTSAQLTTNFSTIKQKLSTFSIGNEQIQQKLYTITQTRNKISNELINLTKDYQKKIKQLQNRLEQSLSKNQILNKQNLLYQKDIEAFQIRLVEKQKLIAMLITQQNQRFGDNILGRSKSQYQRQNKDKVFKKNYQNVLPKNIQQKNAISQNQTKLKQLIKKDQVVPQNKQEALITQQRKQSQRIVQESSQPKVQQIGSQSYFQKLSQENNQQQKFQKSIQNTAVPSSKNKAKTIPPIKNNAKNNKNNPTVFNQGLQIPNIAQRQPSQIIQQQKIQTQNQETFKFDEINQNRLEQNQQNIAQQVTVNREELFKQIKKVPPPPSKKSKNTNLPAPKKKAVVNFNYNQPKYLEDQSQNQNIVLLQQPAINNQNKAQPQVTNNIYNSVDQPSDLIQNYLTTHNVQQLNEDIKQLQHQHHNASEIKHIESQQLQIGTDNHQQMRAPPPSKKVTKTKSKTRGVPKQISQVNFYEQSSHSQSHQQAQTQTNQNNIQYNQKQQQNNNQATPSSQDFFAQLTASKSHQNLQHHYKSSYSSMIEAQQSSIDYADNHSIVSSTVGRMLDSQYFPQQTTSQTTAQVTKMTKKKPNKRQAPKVIDPNSFV